MPDVKKLPVFSSFELFSTLPRERCIARMAAHSQYRESPLRGDLKENYFRVCRRNQLVYGMGSRNSFRPYLVGKLEDVDGGGARIRCHFTLARSVLAMMIFVSVFFGTALINEPAARGIVSGFLLVFISVILIGVALDWRDREYIMEHVGDALGARRV